MIRAFAVPCLAAVTAATPAAAHPHVWIEVAVTLAVEADEVRGVEIDWRFDEMFTEVATMDFDMDFDGRLDTEELAELAAQSRASLADFDYFMAFHGPDGEIPIGAVDGLEARFADDGRLHYRLEVTPPAAARQLDGFGLTLFDPTSYVDLVFAPSPLSMTGAPRPCTETRGFDEGRLFATAPAVLRLSCD